MGVLDSLFHSWTPFKHPAETQDFFAVGGDSTRPDEQRLTGGNENSITNAIYNRIAVDISQLTIQHVVCSPDGPYFEYLVNDDLNQCLTMSANIDQSAQAFMIDAVLNMLDCGHVAIVPVEVVDTPTETSTMKIKAIRAGRVVQWNKDTVRVRVFNEEINKMDEVTMFKKNVAIVQNPFYSVMNEPNSTLRRLVSKLSLLDNLDSKTASSKLDLIIQLPYIVKNETQQKQAERRRRAIEDQLTNSKYGIAYTDGTEKITQLNRSVENNLLSQIEYLTKMVYSQLGITQAILDGSAGEQEIINYESRTLAPIINAICLEMTRKFLSKTARTQRHAIMYYRDPFKMAPVSQIAQMSDQFTRNEIMSSNEIRQRLGMPPDNNPKSDELINKNLNHPDEQGYSDQMYDEEVEQQPWQ